MGAPVAIAERGGCSISALWQTLCSTVSRYERYLRRTHNMHKTLLLLAAITICLPGTPALADFSYEQTSQMTGGSLLQMMRFASKFSKDSRRVTDSVLSTVSIQGNRMMRKTTDEATVTDLDKQTITRISFTDKVYSVTTFEQLKQQMAAMAEKMNSRNPKQAAPTFDVKIDETGQKKEIDGANTHEVKMIITVSVKDESSGNQGAMNMISDMWIAPHVSGYDEVRDFHKRMAETLGWVPGDNPMMSRPDMAKAMAEMYKAGAKLDGMPLASVMRMGANVQGQPQASDPSQASRDNTQTSTPPPTSMGGALAGALGGRFGLGRHKKDSDSDASPAQNGNSNQPDAALLEFTTRVTTYNTVTVDPAVFRIPSGFTQVEEAAMKPRKSY